MRRSLVFLVTLACAAAHAEDCGLTALVKLPDIQRCAKVGNRTAQFVLGSLYFQGKEVPKNYKLAFERMAKAADGGDKDAQYHLGSYYYNGWGTKKDFVQTYKWWSLSLVNNEDPIARRNLEDLERRLSPVDIVKAQELASEWKATHESPRQQ